MLYGYLKIPSHATGLINNARMRKVAQLRDASVMDNKRTAINDKTKKQTRRMPSEKIPKANENKCSDFECRNRVEKIEKKLGEIEKHLCTS